MTRRIYLAPGPLARRATVTIGSGSNFGAAGTDVQVWDYGYRNPDLDGLRAAWSGGAPPVQYLDDGPPFYFRTGLRFTGAGRLTITNPAHPWQLTPGDRVYGTVAELGTATAGTARAGVTFHHTDGSTSEAVLTTHAHGAAPLETPRLVASDVTGATLWVEATAPGWEFALVSLGFDSSAVEVSTITVRRGRTSDSDTPEAASLSATVAMPTAVPVGPDGTLTLHAVPTGLYTDPDDEAAARQRYNGVLAVLDATVTHDGPNVLPVIAASQLTRLGVKVGDTPWPAESAVARAARILELATGDLPLEQPLTGGLTVAARDVDRQSALTLLGELLASSPGCRLVERRDGTVLFLPPPARDTVPDLTLTADVIVEPVNLTQRWGAQVVAVEYGTSLARSTFTLAPDYPWTEGDQRPVRELNTVLGTEEAARLLALNTYANGAVSRWRIPDVTIDVLKLLKRARPADLDTVRALLLAQVGALVQLEDLPLSVPASVAGPKVLEGWSETLTSSSWVFGLYLSDAAGSLEPATWANAAPDTVRWRDLDPSVTWLTAAALTDL